VLAGGLFKASDRLKELIAAGIKPEAPGARLRRLTVAPAAGGVLLAMETAGLLKPDIRAALMQSL
jgi:hypothetical protein